MLTVTKQQEMAKFVFLYKRQTMIAVLKRGAAKTQVNSLWEKLLSRRAKEGIDAYKYCGVIQLKEDALDIQKKLRDEWE